MTQKYFTLLTRGRTGSTAIIDSLNNIKRITCLQEIFRDFDFYDPDLKKFRSKLEKDFKNHARVNLNKLFDKNIDRICPYLYFSKIFKIYGVKDYLEYAESNSRKFGRSREFFGFKVLMNHLESFEQDSLLDTLVEMKYIFFLLKRKNRVAEAISGYFANERQLYHSHPQFKSEKKLIEEKNKEKIYVDPKKIYKEITYMDYNYDKYEKILIDKQVDYKIIYYEDYRDDKDSFFKDILLKLGHPGEYKTKTDYMKVLPEDLSAVISNYTELKEHLKSQGVQDPF